METLLDLVGRIEALGSREAVRWTNGVRAWVWSYDDLDRRIHAFAGFLDRSGIGHGDRIILWSENRPEWIAAFWGALLRGVVVVPVDHHSSADRVRGIRDETDARLTVFGERVDPTGLGESTFPGAGLHDLPEGRANTNASIGPDDVVEILYTSGTTATPKGVVHRHRHIVANLGPIAAEIDRYRRWARPFQPIRFLELIPLSHMFGQSMGVFVPPVLGGSVVFMQGLDPSAVRRVVRTERVSVLVSVPRMLQGLRNHVERHFPTAGDLSRPAGGILRRWWRHRAVHRAFGWKFWAFVVGGARLDESMEAFWARIGLLVVQGYGLTETSPVVAVNHPFHARRGTLGKAIGGQQVRLADDGEILVRGPSVVEEYLGAGGTRTSTVDKEGWFHTGDIGEMDQEGRLRYRGRKKDVIVTAEGTNIHPDDLEAVLNRVPGVQDSVVVPSGGPEGERPHAVLILAPGTDPEAVIDEANRHLEAIEQLRSWSIWPGEDFPRTASTFKVQRRRVAETVRGESPEAGEPAGFADFVARSTGIPRTRLDDPGTRLDDIGLTSLERVELLAGIEERYGVELDEAAFFSIGTIGAMARMVEAGRDRIPAAASPAATRKERRGQRVSPPRWARRFPARATGAALRTLLVRPLLRHFVRVEAIHAERLAAAEAPVVFAATHTSHLDTPVIFEALGPRWRGRIAPAMRQEYFFPPGERAPWRRRLAYVMACVTFRGYPLPQQMGQVRDALRYTGELVGAGYCPLVFPEGRLSPDGAIHEFRPGIGFMAAHLEAPVLPLRIEGAFGVFPEGSRWPGKGTVKVRVGEPVIYRKGESYTAFTARLERAVREMS
jgi:long-chain acyl-CoA synthetase